MKIIIGKTIQLIGADKETVKRITKDLTIPNPDYVRRERMNLWTGNIPKELALYEIHGESLVLPYGTLKKITPMLDDAETVTSRLADGLGFDFEGEDVQLYPYQEKAVQRLLESKYGILQAPAGSGKTQMGIELVKRIGKRALWLTHTTDLLNQSKERAGRYINPAFIGTITAGKVAIGTGITFATVQTLARLDLSQLENYWDTVIIDECHRCSGSPTAMTQFYKVLNSLAAPYKIGLSATVHRSDGTIAATYALLGDVVYSVPEEEVCDRIMKVQVCIRRTGIKMDNSCTNADGTMNYAKMINYLCESRNRNETIISTLTGENRGRSILILSDRVNHLEALRKMLPPEERKLSVIINGKMTSKKDKAAREQAIEDMRTGAKRYLFATYALCKEGLDIPRLERVYLTTPQTDYAVITQSIGRVARVFEGKETPKCYDFVDWGRYYEKAFAKRCATYRKNKCTFESN